MRSRVFTTTSGVLLGQRFMQPPVTSKSVCKSWRIALLLSLLGFMPMWECTTTLKSMRRFTHKSLQQELQYPILLDILTNRMKPSTDLWLFCLLEDWQLRDELLKLWTPYVHCTKKTGTNSLSSWNLPEQLQSMVKLTMLVKQWALLKKLRCEAVLRETEMSIFSWHKLRF